MSICDKYLHFEDCFILGIKLLLQIYNGSMSERDLIGKYCGTYEQVVVVSELTLMEFRSDGSINGPGFNATYHPFQVSTALIKEPTLISNVLFYFVVA